MLSIESEFLFMMVGLGMSHKRRGKRMIVPCKTVPNQMSKTRQQWPHVAVFSIAHSEMNCDNYILNGISPNPASKYCFPVAIVCMYLLLEIATSRAQAFGVIAIFLGKESSRGGGVQSDTTAWAMSERKKVLKRRLPLFCEDHLRLGAMLSPSQHFE